MLNALKTVAITFPPLLIASELTGDEGRWLLISLGVVAFISFLVRNALGSVREFKSLRDGDREPLPVVIEKSLAAKFVDSPKFENFERYVHESHHKMSNELNNAKLNSELLLRDLNEKNEARSNQIFAAIQKEGQRLDGRVNDVLREVSRMAGAYEQSQRKIT